MYYYERGFGNAGIEIRSVKLPFLYPVYSFLLLGIRQLAKTSKGSLKLYAAFAIVQSVQS